MPDLAITGLWLSHFRSYKSAFIEPDAGIIALYGPNGAGKTNILEAISMLSPGRGLRRAAADDMMRHPENLGWKVSAKINTLSTRHEVSTKSMPDAGRFVEIDGKKKPQIVLGEIARILWLVPVMDRLWLEGASERRRFLDRMVMTFHPSHAEASIKYEKSMRERNRLLKDQVRDGAWFDALEKQMAQSGAEISQNRIDVLARLQKAQIGAKTAFPQADLTLLSADDHQPELAADSLFATLQSGRTRDMAAGRTLSGPHRADLHAVYAAKNVAAKSCSTGEQKALLISLILANARALAADYGAPPILLLDEVAAHLDADRRAALYAEITALNAQAWLTGTGAELFEGLEGDAMILQVNDNENGSVIG